MASSVSDDSLDSEIFILNKSTNLNDRLKIKVDEEDYVNEEYKRSNLNLLNKITNRQIFGRVTQHPKASTLPVFNDIYYKCRYTLDQITNYEALRNVFMGFTICGNFFISYTTKVEELSSNSIFPPIHYKLHIWRFVPGQQLIHIIEHRVFKFYKSSLLLDDIAFMQHPLDPYKLICYGVAGGSSSMAFLTILTLPTTNCRNCNDKCTQMPFDDRVKQGWCLKHGFMLHFMFTLSQPTPSFNPHVSLAFPDHIVINTGHCIHILNISTLEPPRMVVVFQEKEYIKADIQSLSCNCTDNLSEVSESPSELFSNNSVVDAIIEDFSEYDLEGNEFNKPFHELNISCEPLNVTGKNYYNVLVQNIVDTRLKHLQNFQKQIEKSKVDKNVAEKAYEFTEENEKCEKLSLFRKKRLADKKYEFSEDNSENIVPFYSLRRERRYFYRPHNCIKSPEFSNSLFLSPRSPGLRSPMQSPNSRNGQFSPGGARNIYCPIVRNCPPISKSPVSPRDSARKFNVYSPGLDSDCSDSDSRLILRQVHNLPANDKLQQSGLLILDPKRDETPKWIKKVVKRYSSIDFENSSLLSGHSRDDNNIPIEIPILVQTLSEQHLEVVPEIKADQLSETQLIITQRTCDCDQFVQSRAQKLCSDGQLNFLHCEDYEIKMIHICPLNGEIVCKAVITIGALQDLIPFVKRNVYIAEFIFTWNIASNSFNVIEPPIKFKLQSQWCSVKMPLLKIPSIVHKKVLVMGQNYELPKKRLRDYSNCFEICMDAKKLHHLMNRDVEEFSDEYSLPSDSDY